LVLKIVASLVLPKNVNIKIYNTIILPVVSYGCETSFRTLNEEDRIWAYDERVVKKEVG
jgi:hypothetical protein